MHTNNSLSLLPVATVFFLTGLLPGSALAAADLAREQRLAEQTVDAILDGDPLRTTLRAAGWATLSLQMPVLARDARFHDYLPVFPDAIPRIDAGINELRAQGFERIILLAHSCVCI